MKTPLPVPDDEQVRAVSRALIRHHNDARRALKRFDQVAYADAMGEARVCQQWLDTYVNQRKDAA